MPRRSIKRYLLISFTLFSIWVIYNTIQIHLYSYQYYDVRSDVAIVLGAGSSKGELSPVFRERVNHAIKLFRDKKVNFIIFTGGFGKGQKISDSKAARNYTTALGIPENKIFIEEKSTITFANLTGAKQIMDNKHLHSALIVSDPYHMKRSMEMCKTIEIPGLPSPTQTSMYRSWKTKSQLLVYESFYYHIGLLFGSFRKK